MFLSHVLPIIISILMIVYYFDAINIVVSELFLDIWKISVPFFVTAYFTQFGFFNRIGLKGLGKHVLNINIMVDYSKSIYIKDDEPDDTYLGLLQSLVLFPTVLSINVLFWMLGIMCFAMGISIYTEEFQWTLLLAFANITFISIFITILFSFKLSEELTYSLRVKCKELLEERSIFYQNISTGSLNVKIFILLGMFLIVLYLTNSITYYNRDEIIYVIYFSFLSLILLSVYIILVLKNFNLIPNQLNSLTDSIDKNEFYFLKTGSLDKEIIVILNKINNIVFSFSKEKNRLEKEIYELKHQLDNSQRKEKMFENKNNFHELSMNKIAENFLLPKVYDWNGFKFLSRIQISESIAMTDYVDLVYFSEKIYIVAFSITQKNFHNHQFGLIIKYLVMKHISQEKDLSDFHTEIEKEFNQLFTSEQAFNFYLISIDKKNKYQFIRRGYSNAIIFKNQNESISLWSQSSNNQNEIEFAKGKFRSGDRLFLCFGDFRNSISVGENGYNNKLLELISIYKNLPFKEQTDTVFSLLLEISGKEDLKTVPVLLSLELNPEWSKFMQNYNAGIKFLHAKKLDLALEFLNEAYRILPGYLDLKFQLSVVHFFLQEYNTSEYLIESYLKEKMKDKNAIQLAINVSTKLNKIEKVEYYMQLLNKVNRQ
jgi:hypothetical protein